MNFEDFFFEHEKLVVYNSCEDYAHVRKLLRKSQSFLHINMDFSGIAVYL